MTALANVGEIPKKYSDPSLYFSHWDSPFTVNIIDPSYLDKCVKHRELI